MLDYRIFDSGGTFKRGESYCVDIMAIMRMVMVILLNTEDRTSQSAMCRICVIEDIHFLFQDLICAEVKIESGTENEKCNVECKCEVNWK